MANKKAAKRKQEMETPVQVKGLPPGVKAVRAVTLSVLSFKQVGTEHTIKILEPMRESESKMIQKDGMKNAHVCPIIDLETGEQHMFVVPTVVRGNLEESYPDNAYVGKCFYIKNDGGRGENGKRYNKYTVIEVNADALKS